MTLLGHELKRGWLFYRSENPLLTEGDQLILPTQAALICNQSKPSCSETKGEKVYERGLSLRSNRCCVFTLTWAAPPCSTNGCTELSCARLHTGSKLLQVSLIHTHTHSHLLLTLASTPPHVLPPSGGFWGIQTNDLRWQQSVKVSVRQQIPLITSNMEPLQRGWRQKSVSSAAHAPSLLPLTASRLVSTGRGSYRQWFIRRNKPPGNEEEQSGATSDSNPLLRKSGYKRTLFLTISCIRMIHPSAAKINRAAIKPPTGAFRYYRVNIVGNCFGNLSGEITWLNKSCTQANISGFLGLSDMFLDRIGNMIALHSVGTINGSVCLNIGNIR